MEQEAEALKKRFIGVNRAKFARDYKIKGGQASVYNHISALRPINLEAARAYAKGFNCTIEEISPRLALEVAESSKYTVSGDAGTDDNPAAPTGWLFDMVDERKVRNLSSPQLISLQTALLIAAAQVGLDIKKDG